MNIAKTQTDSDLVKNWSMPRWVVPTLVASRTPSLPYEFTNILKTLVVNLDQKFHHRKAL